MPRSGLCSVTFRALSATEVVDAAQEAGLGCLEWGTDVHVPVDALANAARVGELTRRAGLRASSLGSYVRAGSGSVEEWRAVVATAQAVGAPRVRIWAGDVGSDEAGTEGRQAVAHWTHWAAEMAEDAGLTVAFEFHRWTLTDSVESTLRLLADIDHPAVSTYWQPRVGEPAAAAVDGLERLLPHVSALHVFSWWPQTQRRPLDTRGDLWSRALALAARGPRRPEALLEFVPDDDPHLLSREAAALHRLQTSNL
ncbi:MAG TPA: TIM barrel protein [Jiangellaceae bacterium]|nr:TIM barrel protein [Jiangellaceae bacterium]